MSVSELRRLLVLGLIPGFACHDPAPPVGADTVATGTSTSPDTLATPTTSSDTPTTEPDPPTTGPGDEESMATSTGEDSGTGSSGTNTTMEVSWCGDGVVDAEEECDDGADGNGDTRFCKKNCTLNVCGDGKLFVGWELCDEGAANSDEYGSLCGKQCQPGARCGDNKLQPEFETCDLGPGNGGAKGDEQGIVCDVSCRAQQLRGFVTNDAFTGDMGGLHGADLKCQAAATAAGLAEPERFHAYLSTGNTHAKDLFADVATSWPYVLVTGKKFANNFAALIDAGPLGDGISVTEEGNTLYKAHVATNTQPGGLSFSSDQHCQGWTSINADYKGRVGISALPDGSPDADAWKDEQWWTGVTYWHCNKAFFHLYCLEI